MGATWKSVNHENLACAYKWDFDFGYEQVAKADCEYPIDCRAAWRKGMILSA